MISRIPATAVVCWFSAATWPVAADDRAASLLEAINREVSSLYEKSRDAVVRVHALHRPAPGGITLMPPRRVGTGFFIRPNGTLVTAATIVSGAESCTVEFHNAHLMARLLGCDPRSNLAVLKVDPPNRETPALPLGDPHDLHVGSMVVAIGFPYDLPSAPSVGFVGGFDIRQGRHVFPTSHLRASCRLSPGQAGSPLLNARGELVGMAVAAHAENDCYALPIDAAQKVWTDILNKGAPQHGWVGLEVTEKSADVAPAARLVVAQVFSNTPAAQAGFLPGDTLLRIETNDVHRLADLMNTMFYRQAGD
ncbi:MAG: serine protease, partial [Planctomycetes bacterium]|nr:serine protease [Planctomycetota bacterium]